MRKIVVVGAGISGLTIAYRLEQAAPPVELVVLEENARPGGTVWTERAGGFQVEIGPNGFLDSKASTVTLCQELGLGDRLVPASEGARQNRYLFLNGQLRQLPGSLGALLRTDLLSWRGKVSLLAERFRPRRRGDVDESVQAFARRRAGAEVAEVFGDALVTGIYAGDPALLSIGAAFPRLAALENRYGSVLKGLGHAARERRRQAAARGEPVPTPARMWSFREGLRLLIETLVGRLRRPPSLGTAVQRIYRSGAGSDGTQRWTVSADRGGPWQADAVVLACPAHRQAALLNGVDRDLADQVGAIPYNRVGVVALGFRRQDVPGELNGFGYIAPQATRRDLLGVQWCSSIFPERAAAGFVLLRALCGGWHRPEVVGWDDDRLLAAARAELRLAMGITAAPVFHRIIRWDRAIPQYHLGHLKRVAWIEERAGRHPGLFLAGNAYHGVALNDCTEQAGGVAERVRQYLLHGSSLKTGGGR